MKIVVVAVLATLWAGAALAKDNSVNNAFALCKVIDGTGLTSSPCEVSGWNSAVIATIDMTSSEARKTCTQIAGAIGSRGLDFSSGWTLQIKSPYSGDKSIAFCNL